ncbi:hypothetical protein BU202_02800 [Streptococcus cuniculi]|uniref:Uncharacterized protein n=1 Tax=Streptococcus cuniculi TaxID=1432788 RepID=A0A1Q8E9V7_9STRE|nr:Imm53 family immunity protein [Streptococcus cuniculi]OLF48563.1 hypothetical protein BU202_02800 [Streptococcus cuniculi]
MFETIEQLAITTADNTGWGIEVYYDKVISSERMKLLSRNVSKTDWIIQFIEGNHLDTAGDQHKLSQLIELIVEYIKRDLLIFILERCGYAMQKSFKPLK